MKSHTKLVDEYYQQKRKEKVIAEMRQLQVKRHRQGSLDNLDDSKLRCLKIQLQEINDA